MSREKELWDNWESWGHLIRDDVERLDRKLYLAMSDSVSFGVSREECTRFFQKRLLETIESVAKEREAKGKAAKRI
ncbi:hypothetical protein [Paenibacillus apiarius]|uniref:hypothetical protein n=1 Tax=Paenibacillus apiarius TaxID=46240 RepID=UPI003B3A2784